LGDILDLDDVIHERAVSSRI